MCFPGLHPDGGLCLVLLSWALVSECWKGQVVSHEVAEHPPLSVKPLAKPAVWEEHSVSPHPPGPINLSERLCLSILGQARNWRPCNSASSALPGSGPLILPTAIQEPQGTFSAAFPRLVMDLVCFLPDPNAVLFPSRHQVGQL